LNGHGWVVWWDRKIIPGNKFDEVIEQHLETAKSVVVLWSEASVRSEWVKNEAAVAAERGVLVPALIDHARLPLEFRRKQTANLVGWRGDPAHPEFESLCEGIAETLDELPLRQDTKHRPQKFQRNGLLAMAVIGVVTVVILIGAYVIIQSLTTAPSPDTECPEITVWDYSKIPPESRKEKRCSP
jgi:TIR domain